MSLTSPCCFLRITKEFYSQISDMFIVLLRIVLSWSFQTVFHSPHSFPVKRICSVTAVLALCSSVMHCGLRVLSECKDYSYPMSNTLTVQGQAKQNGKGSIFEGLKEI